MKEGIKSKRSPHEGFCLILFSIFFISLNSVLLGEFFYGNSFTLFLILLSIFSFSIFFAFLMALLSAQGSWPAELAGQMMKMFVIFPFLSLRKGFFNLVFHAPVRTAIGSSFSLCFIIIVFSSSVYWSKITNKLTFNRKLTKSEQAKEDIKTVRRMLKYYKRNFGDYPPTNSFVESLIKAKKFEKVSRELQNLKIKTLGNQKFIIDPWNKPYVYLRYKKWKIFKSYKFYSQHIKSMK